MEDIKPIHKFNNGVGATLCNECSVIISLGNTDDLYCEDHGGEFPTKYKLVRFHDGLIKYGNKILWIEWKDDGTFGESHDEIGVERSLIVDPISFSYHWLTTPVTEILEHQDKYIKFKTENSVYELYER